jgi:hypothetical protein
MLRVEVDKLKPTAIAIAFRDGCKISSLKNQT